MGILFALVCLGGIHRGCSDQNYTFVGFVGVNSESLKSFSFYLGLKTLAEVIWFSIVQNKDVISTFVHKTMGDCYVTDSICYHCSI